MNRRVLIVDDTKGIHDDFKKILTSSGPVASGLASARAAFFGETPSATTGASGNQLCAEVSYELTYCFQGLEALELLAEGPLLLPRSASILGYTEADHGLQLAALT